MLLYIALEYIYIALEYIYTVITTMITNRIYI